MTNISSRFLATLSLLTVMSSIPALELNYSFSATDISAAPEVIRVLIYDSEDAAVPLKVVDYAASEIQLKWKDDGVQIRAELEDELDPKDLWVEVELDNKLKGTRIPLAAATLGITFALGNNLNMDGNAIVNVAPPSTPDAAATKNYVDNKVAPTCIRRQSALIKLDTWFTRIDQSCALGETLVSGGFRYGNYSTDSNCRVIASYPDGNTWRVVWGMPTETECAAHDARTYALCCKW